jgi:hypothetical protein
MLAAVTAGGQSRDIVGATISCSDNRVYAWYARGAFTAGNNPFSIGTTPLLTKYSRAGSYSLPPGKDPEDIVGMGIARTGKVYTWYMDGTVSVGTLNDLDKHESAHAYSLPPGKAPSDIVGIDIACSNSHVYAWYRDGTVSGGTSTDLDAYRPLYAYALPSGHTPDNVVAFAIARDDHVYAWYDDGTASAGTSYKLDQYRAPYDYYVTLEECTVWATVPQQVDFVVSGVGSRGPACRSPRELVVRIRHDISLGFDKTLASASATAMNPSVPVRFDCSHSGGQWIFVEALSEGQKKQSPRLFITCN